MPQWQTHPSRKKKFRFRFLAFVSIPLISALLKYLFSKKSHRLLRAVADATIAHGALISGHRLAILDGKILHGTVLNTQSAAYAGIADL